MSQLIGKPSTSFLRALVRLPAVLGHLMPKWRPPVRTELPSSPTELLMRMTTAEWADLPTWHPISPED